MSPRSASLVSWALGTFHASLFVLAIVVVLYARRDLGGALQGLNTALGLALFGALWATTAFTTARALRGLTLFGHGADVGRLVGRGAWWGGVNGPLFLVVLVVPILLSLPGPRTLDAVIPTVLAVLVYAGLFGTVVAFALGAVVGCVLALVDSALLAVARRISAG